MIKQLVQLALIVFVFLQGTALAVWVNQNTNAPQLRISVKLDNANSSNLSENSSLSLTIKQSRNSNSNNNIAKYTISPLLLHPEGNEAEAVMNVHRDSNFVIKIDLKKIDKNSNLKQCNIEKQVPEINKDTYIPVTIDVKKCQME